MGKYFLIGYKSVKYRGKNYKLYYRKINKF